jgi:hypothetical protein
VADFRLLRFQGGTDGRQGSVANHQAEGTESDGEQSAGHSGQVVVELIVL